MSVTRELVNFLIAIVLTAFVCGIMFALPPLYPPALKYPGTAVGILIIVWLFSLPIVAVGGLVFGMPIAFVLNSRKVRRLGWWVAAGALAGGLFAFLILAAIAGPWFMPFSSLAIFDALTSAWIGLLPGGVAAVYWWAAMVRRDQTEGEGA